MIYWRCEPETASRWFLIAILLISNIIQLNLTLYLVAHLLLLGISTRLYILYLEYERDLPIAISFHKDSWQINQLDSLFKGKLSHGFALGPIAYVKLRDETESTPTYQRWLTYWQVADATSDAQGNWHQLVSLIRQDRP